MANLIPRASLASQGYSIMSRTVFAGAFAAVFCSGTAILGILPAYFIAHTDREALEASLETFTMVEKNGERSERDKLIDARKRANALARIGKRQQLTESIFIAVQELPSGVTLRSFTYSRKDGVSTLAVVGTSAESSLFRQYTEALKGKPIFDKVTVPLTSLANIEGGSFSVSMAGSF